MKNLFLHICILMMVHAAVAAEPAAHAERTAPAQPASNAELAANAEPDTAFNNLFRRDIGGWIAADATFSILLPDGSTLWLFGDTFIGEVNPDNSIKSGSDFIRNSAVIQQGDVLHTLYSGTPADPYAFLPTSEPDSTWYWPEHGVVEDDSLYIFVAKFRHADNGSQGFNFEHAGNDIAVLTYPELERVRTFPIEASAVNGVLYGDRILVDTTYTYIYGRRSDAGTNIPYPHVARATNGNVHSLEWQFYNGSGWSSEPMETSRINHFQVSQQYSVSKFRGKYILLTQDIWLSPKLFSFTSDNPTGPWSNKRLLYTTPETSGSTFTYNAYVHPQFNRNAEMLVSYNVNGDFWSIFSNVEIYRPRFIRIPYMNLDYAFWPNAVRENTAGTGQGINVYPNPVRTNAIVQFQSGEFETGRIEIMDIRGRTVLPPQEILPGGGMQEIHIDLSTLPPGMYICSVVTDRQIQTISIIKSSGNQ